MLLSPKMPTFSTFLLLCRLLATFQFFKLPTDAIASQILDSTSSLELKSNVTFHQNPTDGLREFNSEQTVGKNLNIHNHDHKHNYNRNHKRSSPVDLAQEATTQLSLVSVRGSLAFYRPNELLGQATSFNGKQNNQVNQFFQLWPNVKPISANNRPITGAAAAASASKCPQSNHNYATGGGSARWPMAEVVTIEGSNSIKLNIVISSGKRVSFGEELRPEANLQSQPTATTSSPNSINLSKFKLHWTHNGVSMENFNSPRSKFKQEVVGENNNFLLRQYLNKMQTPTNQLQGNKNSIQQEENFHRLGAFNRNDSPESFKLAPYAHEKLATLLAEGQGSSQLNNFNSYQAQENSKLALNSLTSALNNNQLKTKVDDFLNDASSIDWAKLAEYLSKIIRAEDAECGSSIEQLTIVQVELNHLSSKDRGLYELSACRNLRAVPEVGSQATECFSLNFNLIVLEDYPKFESKPESKILNIGDRLSIKCEATGFTLPQITWFLDNQQLNEHGPPTSASNLAIQNQQQREPSSLESSGSNFHQLDSVEQQHPFRLRIGDYVTQDNHVHSYVNSSYVQLNEAGFYKCQANNGFHTIEHEIRVDVRGPPLIARPMKNLSVLIGTSALQIQCPYGGYPINSIEWYFKPTITATTTTSEHSNDLVHRISQSSDSSLSMLIDGNKGQSLNRLKRIPAVSEGELRRPEVGTKTQQRLGTQANDKSYLLDYSFLSDNDQDDHDPDHDDWLSQASSLTPDPRDSDQEYPDQMPSDYPGSQAHLGDSNYDSDIELVWSNDYAVAGAIKRRRRDTSSSSNFNQMLQEHEQKWLKFPQGRRHQVYLNGSLIIQDVSRSDQGFYKCKVLANRQAAGSDQAAGSESGHLEAFEEVSSNEFQLTVLVPPVISPFASSESLREGMRNFLTCSVIEGDSPINLRWFKDSRPIEEYIHALIEAQQGDLASLEDSRQSFFERQQKHSRHQQRLRVETSNEFTSTLHFSHVEFRDNGNYTCMATNKASSVNYTARMLVSVPPKWIRAPKDVECVSGQSIVIDCQAQAYPNPRVWWEIGIYTPPANSQTPATTSQQTQHSSTPMPTKIHPTTAEASPATLLSGPTSGQMKFQPTDQKFHLQAPSGGAAVAPPNGQLANSQHPPNHYRTIISNSRIHILENASLVIKDVNKFDQGYYLCQAANNFGSLSSLIKLTVNVGATFAQKHLIKYVKLNDRIEFDCDPIGQSPIEVAWFVRDQVAIGNDTGLLKTTQTNFNQTSIKPSSSFIDSLMSIGFPLISNKQQSSRTNNNQHTGTGSGNTNKILSSKQLFAATIKTDSNSNQAVVREQKLNTETALFQEQQSEHNEQNHIYMPGSISFEAMKRNDLIQSEFVRLTIRRAKRFHSAHYLCRASNKYGQEEKLIELLVQEAPDPVSEINIVSLESRSVVLNWPQPFDGNSPISLYTVEFRPTQQLEQSSNFIATYGISENVPNEKKWFQQTVQQPAISLGSLQPMTSYALRVRAQNQFGQSNESQAIMFTTNEEAPTLPPSDVEALAQSSNSLQLSWLPPSLEGSKSKYSVKGYYLGYKIANSSDSHVFKTVVTTGDSTGLTYDAFNHLYATIQSNHTQQQQHSVSTNDSQNRASAGRVRVVIGDLKRSTRYSIIVQAFNSAGSGPQSDSVEVRTLANDPPPAPLLRVGMVTYSSIEIQWSFMSQDTRKTHFADVLNIANDFSIPSLPMPVARVNSIHQFNNQENNQMQSMIKSGETWPNKNSTSMKPNQGDGSNFNSIEGYYLYYRKYDTNNNLKWIEKRLSPETHSIISLRNEVDLSIVPQAARNVELIGSDNQTSLGFSQTSSSSTNLKFSPVDQMQAWSSTIDNDFQPGKQIFKSFRFMLDQLTCGTSYQIHLIAYNSIGSGQSSQIIKTKTRGSQPIAPREQDYFSINSTCVRLNLDAWMDGGCSITNFEIRYRQVNSRFQSNDKYSSNDLINGDNSRQWLLLAANISAEQRFVDLGDLQPETWYSVLTIAVSQAGQTEVVSTFMTLDKYGQVPAEAMLAGGPNYNNPDTSGHIPALFRAGNGSIRSILYQFSNGNHQYFPSSMFMSLTICLIIFATCALIIIKRYNNMMGQKDNASIDSRTTSGAMSSARLFQVNNHVVNRHDQAHNEQYRQSDYLLYQQQKNAYNSGGSSNSNSQECYLMKSSPCKTTTTTVLTNSSNNLSSVGQGCGIDQSTSQSCINQSSILPVIKDSNRPVCQLQPYGAIPNGLTQAEEFCSVVACDSPGHMQGTGKFSTLNTKLDHNQHDFMQQQQPTLASLQQQHNRFKTMPYNMGLNGRPLSTFISNGVACNNNNNQNRYLCQPNDLYPPHLHQSINPQQVYSKLHLIQNSKSNYNLCSENQKAELDELLSMTTNCQLNGNGMDSEQQLQESDTTVAAINLAALAQQNPKLMATLKRVSSGQPQNPEELASLMSECQHQLNSGGNNFLNQYNQIPIPQTLLSSTTDIQQINSQLQQGNNNDFLQQSTIVAQANGDISQTSDADKPINPTITSTAGECFAKKILEQNNQPNKNTNGQSQFNNEPSDYALPFPPKWV